MTTNRSNNPYTNYAYINENIRYITEQVAQAKEKARRTDVVRIMAVTKTVPAVAVNYAIEKGIALLGENRAQELLSKAADYDTRAEIHFIGHLQTNKVRSIADKVSMIESVDSLHLATEIDRRCEALGKTMDVLLEVNVGGEESKSGVAPGGLRPLIEQISLLPNIKIRGLMAIPPIGAPDKYFSQIQKIYIDIKAEKMDNVSMDFLSMGMSNDFTKAIEYGSNIVRIGTKLFGLRK